MTETGVDYSDDDDYYHEDKSGSGTGKDYSDNYEASGEEETEEENEKEDKKEQDQKVKSTKEHSGDVESSSEGECELDSLLYFPSLPSPITRYHTSF